MSSDKNSSKSSSFGTKMFMPFVVLGDPSVESSISVIKSLVDNGANGLELGFAFSDPIADGPVIQAANKRALDNGITTAKNFEILKEIRLFTNIPISLMLSFNIMFNYGIDEFYAKCAELKINAVLVPDVPLEESSEILGSAQKNNILTPFIISPITNDDRMKKISEICTGYAYLVSVLGTTGARNDFDVRLKDLIIRAKKIFDVPLYVGFGISNPEQVRNVLDMGADGAISGSAFCKLVEKNLDNSDKMAKDVGEFCKKMCASL